MTSQPTTSQKTKPSLILASHDEKLLKFNNILSHLTRKEKTKLKNDFKALTIRYEPKINRTKYLLTSNEITADFRDMETELNEIINYPLIKIDKNTWVFNVEESILIKKYNYLNNKYMNIINNMREFIGVFKCVSRGKWGNTDETEQNFTRFNTYIILKKHKLIKSTCKRILKKINEKKILFPNLLKYYMENDKAAFKKRLIEKAQRRETTFLKYVLISMKRKFNQPDTINEQELTTKRPYTLMKDIIFNALYNPIKLSGIEEKEAKTIKRKINKKAEEIINKQYVIILDILEPLGGFLTPQTEYEILYDEYFKNL